MTIMKPLSRKSISCTLWLIGFALSPATLATEEHGTVAGAELLLRQGEVKEAGHLIDKILQSEPSNAAAHYAAGNIYGRQAQEASFVFAAGLARKSLKGFKEAVRLVPNNAEYRFGLMGYYLQAPSIAGGDRTRGVKQAEAIGKLDVVKGYLATAMMYEMTKQPEKLASHYASATPQMLEDPDIVIRRGMYFQTEERYDDAIADFTAASIFEQRSDTDIVPFQALYQIGRTSVFSQRFAAEGERAMSSYIARAPDDDRLPSKAWAIFRLGQIKLNIGDYTEAIRLFDKAQALTKDPDLKKALKKARKKLKRASRESVGHADQVSIHTNMS